MDKVRRPFNRQTDGATPRRPPQGDKPSKGSRFQDHMVAASGEFVGTFFFLWFAFAGHLMAVNQNTGAAVANQQNSSTTVVYISLAYGFSLLINVWMFYRISGGLFNPAVTFGMVLAGALPPVRALFLVPTQLIACMVAAGLVEAMFSGNIQQVNTVLAPGTSIAQGVFIEMFLTCGLVFAVLMLAAEKSKDTFIAPIGIGIALFVAELAGVYYTGGSLNPARSFGPAVAGRQFPHYHWIYWIGPLLGAAITAGYFRFVKYFNYEEANPGQDASHAPSEDDNGTPGDHQV